MKDRKGSVLHDNVINVVTIIPLFIHVASYLATNDDKYGNKYVASYI